MTTLTNNTQTVTLNGAAIGDFVLIASQAAPTAGLSYFAWVSAPNTISITAFNGTSGTITPVAANFNFLVVKA
jgi:hypothetical protein